MNSKEFIKQWRDGLKAKDKILSMAVWIKKQNCIFCTGYNFDTERKENNEVELYYRQELIAIVELKDIVTVEAVLKESD